MLIKRIFIWCLTGVITFAQVTITDITSTHLIGDAYNNGLYGGHGVMFADVDGDGDPDLYITMNNFAPMADQFFENQGNGMFIEKAVERGIDNFDPLGSHGWVWADLDNDGDFDAWNGSYTNNIPYRNRNDQPGYFIDFFNTSGIHNLNYGTRGIAAFDFNGDGYLDLFANNWYSGGYMEENEFYRNNGNSTFTRIDHKLTFAKGDQGVCDGDVDNDGDIDLILCVFEDENRCVEIWENINGYFSRVENTGIDLCGTVDGVTFWDMNNDGWLDVVSGEKIFINNGNKTFTELPNVPPGMRFMRGIADLNNDGLWDLVSPGSNKVYINNGDLTFTAVNFSSGPINDPRSISFADIDRDGDVDFVLGQKEYFNRLYRNDYSGNNRYLFVNLKTANNQIGAFGAKVYIYSETGDTLLSYRQARSSQGYLAQDDPTLHFGCGQRTRVMAKVVFLNNNVIQVYTNTNETVNVFEGELYIYPPTELIASTTHSEIYNVRLNWLDNAINNDGYVIERKIGDSLSNNPFIQIDSTFANSTAYEDSTADILSAYTYRVKAFNSQAASDYSNIAQVLAPVPVELTHFTARLKGKEILISWQTATETNNMGFEIEKRGLNKTWEKIGFVHGSGNSQSIKNYSFSDNNTFGSTQFSYRLKQMNHNGSYSYSNIAEVKLNPDYFELSQNFPNPFNPETIIEFTIPFEANVKLLIHNSVGELVKELINEYKSAGYHQVQFNGSELSSGVYFYTLNVVNGLNDNLHSTKSMIIMK